jgi:carbamoyltransferase
MLILGIHFGHNATAVLLKDGIVLGCVSEERFNGIKNYTGFPYASIEYLLKEFNLKKTDIDYAVLPYMNAAPIFGSEEKKKDLSSRLLTLIYYPVSIIRSIWGNIEYYLPVLRPISLFFYKLCVDLGARLTIKKQMDYIASFLGIDRSKVLSYDHHLCHGVSAYYGSAYNKEDAIILTLDGEGDKLCATVSEIRNGELKRLSETPIGNSLGWIYMDVTRYLGMKPGEHEYKVMGLAPYAKSYGINKVYQKIKDIITLDPKDQLAFKSKFDTHHTYKYLTKAMVGFKFDDISGAFQKLVEDLITLWVKTAIKKTGLKTVTVAGGVFMNVKANLRIAEIDEVEKFFVFPSAGDESSVIGAAYQCYIDNSKDKDIESINNLYWGPKFTNNEIEQFIKDNGYDKKYKVEKLDNIAQKAAQLLSEDKILARVSGRMEWGARALGNRSILANPKDSDNVRLINEQIKMRDFWMPFTPSILKERELDYIINPKGIDSKFMAITFHSTKLAQKDLRAAMHAYDFTIRPQLVDEGYNPEYYKLIKEFEKITGIGGVLNTSFNIHGMPMVRGPKEALEAVENSGLEYLILEDYLISKKQ